MREAAKSLGIHPLEMQDILMARGIPVQDLHHEELKE